MSGIGGHRFRYGSAMRVMALRLLGPLKSWAKNLRHKKIHIFLCVMAKRFLMRVGLRRVKEWGIY